MAHPYCAITGVHHTQELPFCKAALQYCNPVEQH